MGAAARPSPGAPAADRDRGQQLDRVVVPGRAGARRRRLAHRAGHLERVAAGAAPVLIAGHDLSLSYPRPPRAGRAAPSVSALSRCAPFPFAPFPLITGGCGTASPPAAEVSGAVSWAGRAAVAGTGAAPGSV